MSTAKAAADTYAHAISALLPDGRDKDSIMRKLTAIALVIDTVITHTE